MKTCIMGIFNKMQLFKQLPQKINFAQIKSMYLFYKCAKIKPTRESELCVCVCVCVCATQASVPIDGNEASPHTSLLM